MSDVISCVCARAVSRRSGWECRPAFPTYLHLVVIQEAQKSPTSVSDARLLPAFSYYHCTPAKSDRRAQQSAACESVSSLRRDLLFGVRRRRYCTLWSAVCHNFGLIVVCERLERANAFCRVRKSAPWTSWLGAGIMSSGSWNALFNPRLVQVQQLPKLLRTTIQLHCLQKLFKTGGRK